MRVKLEEGRQKELILLAKKGCTWKELADFLGIPVGYLSGDIYREKVLISLDVFKKLCNICGMNFDKYVLEFLGEGWGRSKGGLNSRGSIIDIEIPRSCCELAEFVGAVLGDGHVHFTKKDFQDRKVGVYQIRITGDLRYEEDYHNYLGDVAKSLFGIIPKYFVSKKKNERYLSLSSKKLVEFFGEMGIMPGSKIANRSTVPKWIFENEEYIKACLRGLIDTDGTFHRMSKRDFNLFRIGFTNHNKKLLEDTRRLFLRLNYHPTRIIGGRNFYLSRQEEVRKYLKEIGFSNKKHLDRLEMLKAL